jgi:3-mercaptopyruvate sulfurtransferase SseA
MHMLRDMGFEDVYALRGGILAWRAEGLPVAVGESESPPLEGSPSDDVDAAPAP